MKISRKLLAGLASAASLAVLPGAAMAMPPQHTNTNDHHRTEHHRRVDNHRNDHNRRNDHDHNRRNDRDRHRHHQNDHNAYRAATSAYNVATNARANFYRRAHSPNWHAREVANFELARSYQGSALTYLRNQVRNWPFGNANVSFVRVNVERVQSSNHGRQVNLTTRESWRVTSHRHHHNRQTTLFQEYSRQHHVTMMRENGRWVVTNVY